jgi:hypothetical protein
VVVGLILAVLLVSLGVGAAYRQRAMLRRLREDRYLPSDDRAYLRGQVRRRLAVSAVLVVVGGMIIGHYASGMDARLDEISTRKQAANANPPAEPDPADEQDREFTRFVIVYWIAVLGLLFVAVCLAVFDFWATRRYWMAQYRRIKQDHDTKLQRDLAVYRQAKDNERLGRLRGRKPGTDDTDPNGEPPI